MEHEKYKRLVTELKRRRSEGESVSIIKNGAIIVRSGMCLNEENMMNDVCSAVLFTID